MVYKGFFFFVNQCSSTSFISIELCSCGLIIYKLNICVDHLDDWVYDYGWIQLEFLLTQWIHFIILLLFFSFWIQGHIGRDFFKCNKERPKYLQKWENMNPWKKLNNKGESTWIVQKARYPQTHGKYLPSRSTNDVKISFVFRKLPLPLHLLRYLFRRHTLLSPSPFSLFNRPNDSLSEHFILLFIHNKSVHIFKSIIHFDHSTTALQAPCY